MKCLWDSRLQQLRQSAGEHNIDVYRNSRSLSKSNNFNDFGRARVHISARSTGKIISIIYTDGPKREVHEE